MSVTGCKNQFWCVEVDCASYNTGKECKTCEYYGKCQHCVLQGTKNKPDGCADEAYYIMFGYPEEEE
jgi:hypothetical protein